MADDREFSNVYTIPPNYTDSGKLLGGLLETRNTVEACILLLLVGYPELMWMHLPATAKVVVMTVTLLPLGVFALMGIGGDDSHTQETPVGTKAQAVGKKQPPVWSSYRTTFPSKRSETGSLKLQMAGTSKSWKLNPSTFCFAPMRSSGALSLRLPAGLKFRPCACSLSP